MTHVNDCLYPARQAHKALVQPEVRILVERPRQASVKRRLLQGSHPLCCCRQVSRVSPQELGYLPVTFRRGPGEL